MIAFIFRRLLWFIPMLFIASLIIFLMLRLGPSDPAMDYLRLSHIPPTPQALSDTRHLLGLDQPIFQQYLHWLNRALQGDFGYSYAYQRPVLQDMLHFMPATLQLAGFALIMMLFFSLLLGVWAARYHHALPDHIVRAIAFLGVSMPNFWLGFLLIGFFSVTLHWLPASGRGGLSHIILPAITIAFMSLSINARLLRSTMLTAAGQRHVLYARLRGVPESVVERSHILRNGLLPILTALGMNIGELLGGTLVIETIFGWPGVGRYAVMAIFNRDYPIIQCFTLFMVAIFMLCNLLIDLLYAWVDPRISFSGRRGQG